MQNQHRSGAHTPGQTQEKGAAHKPEEKDMHGKKAAAAPDIKKSEEQRKAEERARSHTPGSHSHPPGKEH